MAPGFCPHAAPADDTGPVAPDLLQHRFSPAAPNRAWTGDILNIPTNEGWLDQAAVLALHSRQVVGWSLQA